MLRGSEQLQHKSHRQLASPWSVLQICSCSDAVFLPLLTVKNERSHMYVCICSPFGVSYSLAWPDDIGSLHMICLSVCTHNKTRGSLLSFAKTGEKRDSPRSHLSSEKETRRTIIPKQEEVGPLSPACFCCMNSKMSS